MKMCSQLGKRKLFALVQNMYIAKFKKKKLAQSIEIDIDSVEYIADKHSVTVSHFF